MNVSHSLFLAKKYLVENIYCSINIEGIAMTFPETQTLCDGISVSGHSIEDINAVVDLKHAWEWIFENYDKPVNLDTVRTLNRLLGKYTVTNAGCIRTAIDDPIVVFTKNGYFYPELPKRPEIIDSELLTLSVTDNTNKALEMFCYLTKHQLFNDGNKRTATLVANMVLIQSGIGVLRIPPEYKTEFYNKLTDYYEDDNKKTELKAFLSDRCIIAHKEKTVGEKIMALREGYDYSREDIFNLTGISILRQHDIELDKSEPTDIEVVSLAKIYQIAPERIRETADKIQNTINKGQQTIDR